MSTSSFAAAERDRLGSDGVAATASAGHLSEAARVERLDGALSRAAGVSRTATAALHLCCIVSPSSRTDGRFVTASAMDLDGNVLVERLRMVFAKGTPPEQAVRLLKGGDRLHVFGMPRLDVAEISRRVKDYRTNPALLTQPLPYEIVILGVYPK
jgi:hypothetical protein